jgi:hypothetical protein
MCRGEDECSLYEREKQKKEKVISKLNGSK